MSADNREICEYCETGYVTTVIGPYTTAFRDGKYTVPDSEYQQCDHCGRVYFKRGQMDSLHRKAAALARRKQGLLTPDEIRCFRLELGCTQTQFERLLGLGPKTVTRWEKGTVFQNKVADTFLRLLMDNPELVLQLAGSSGIVEEPAQIPRQRSLPIADESADDLPIVEGADEEAEYPIAA